MAARLPDQLSAKRLDDREVLLGRPCAGRWRWFWTTGRTRVAKHRLAKTKPMATTRYESIFAQMLSEFAGHRRAQRRRIAVLWLGIVLAAMFAALRRYWVTALLVTAFAAVAFGLWTFRDELSAFARQLAPPGADLRPPPADPEMPRGSR